MSYVVLARKYRPRSFEQLVGQDPVVRALTHALEGRRLHHAYLFTGTRGIGKTTISRILAKSLNCTGADGRGDITARPCGTCQACTEIDADRYMDYVELDAASNRGIDEVRDLLERAAYKPAVGRFKVFMIDEAHQLTKESFNALLKTLEEPPDYLKFVLATTDPEKMLPTVLSRCLQFNLRPIAPDVVHEHLQRVLDAEGVGAEPAALRLLSRAARGSMRDALSLADQAIAYGGGALSEGVVRTMLGAVDRGHAERLVDALARRDAVQLLASIDRLREAGHSAAGTLEEMASLLQQMAVAQAVPAAIDDGDPGAAGVRSLAAALPPDETQLLYSIVIHGRGELVLAPDEYAGLTMTLLRLFAFPPAGGAPRPAAPSAEGTPAPRPAATPVAAAVAPPSAVASAVALAVPEATPAASALGDRWAAVVGALDRAQAIGAMARELAMQSELVAADDGDPPRWRLRVERESLRADAQRERLQDALRRHLGMPLVLEVEPGRASDSPAQRDAAERARRQREAERLFHDDPLVQQMLAQFSTARVVPGSIKPN